MAVTGAQEHTHLTGQPRLGMNLYLWTTRVQDEHFPLLGKLKAAGFDGVEIPSADYSAAELRQIRHALLNDGLSCTVASLLTETENPISPDPAIRKGASEKVKADLEVVAGLGAEALVGPIHSAHKQFCGRGPTEAEFERCVAFLGDAGRRAMGCGAYLAIEPLNRFECYFLNTAEQATRLVAAVDCSNVGVLYDTHHANIEERDVRQALVCTAPHLAHFHVSESHRGTPGTGTVDWATHLATLKELDYSGWLVIEAFATDVPGIQDSLNLWRDCFRSKEAVYLEGLKLLRGHLDT